MTVVRGSGHWYGLLQTDERGKNETAPNPAVSDSLESYPPLNWRVATEKHQIRPERVRRGLYGDIGLGVDVEVG